CYPAGTEHIAVRGLGSFQRRPGGKSSSTGGHGEAEGKLSRESSSPFRRGLTKLTELPARIFVFSSRGTDKTDKAPPLESWSTPRRILTKLTKPGFVGFVRADRVEVAIFASWRTGSGTATPDGADQRRGDDVPGTRTLGPVNSAGLASPVRP